MGVPMRGAAARNQQAKSRHGCHGRRLEGRPQNDNRNIPALQVARKSGADVPLTANATREQIEHQIETFSDARVTSSASAWMLVEMFWKSVTDRELLDDFVKDRLKVLGSQLK